MVQDMVCVYNNNTREFHTVVRVGSDVCGYPRTVHGGLTAAIADESFGGAPPTHATPIHATPCRGASDTLGGPGSPGMCTAPLCQVSRACPMPQRSPVCRCRLSPARRSTAWLQQHCRRDADGIMPMVLLFMHALILRSPSLPGIVTCGADTQLVEPLQLLLFCCTLSSAFHSAHTLFTSGSVIRG